MGQLLEARTGTPSLEIAGNVVPIQAARADRTAMRVAFQERNSPDLVQRLVGCLDAGSIPVLAHPRWPQELADNALLRAGAGTAWTGESVSTLLFTSGSTAEPKIVAHTLNAHLSAAKASGLRVAFGPGDRWLLSLPLCHVGGLSLLFRAIVGGGTLVLPEPEERLDSALVRTRPSHVSLVATQLRALLNQPDARDALGACREVLVGGGPCPPEWLSEAQQAGVPVRLTYGLTEMGSQVATEQDGVLLPLERVEVRVASGGEIGVRGPSRFAGYLEGDRLVRPFEDGWFATGDLGARDSRGALTVHGRLDNQFISGGENVQPEAIEAAFAARGIEVVVVDVPDARFGARPVAFSRDGLSHAKLAIELLPDFARPIAWLPLLESEGLKPRRAELRRRALER